MKWLRLAQLQLDPRNPRLPSDVQNRSVRQRDLAEYINKHYDPLAIAESVAQHEFFESEPLIAVEAEGGLHTVIEGNRRLTALMGLSDPVLRASFAEENSGWSRLPDTELPDSFPVLVVGNAEEVAPLLGYRHISGIEPWDPFAQARYVVQLVDNGEKSLAEVAELVGRSLTEVNRMYRDFDILRQAEQEFGLDVSRAKRAFGVFNNAMGRTAVREFINAPAPREVDPKTFSLPDAAKPRLKLLLDLIFGGPRGEGRVVKDSRQLGSLAKVLADNTGTALKVLRRSHDLEEALDATSDPEAQFNRAVKSALKNLEKAANLKDAAAISSIADLRRIRKLSKRLIEEAVPEEGR